MPARSKSKKGSRLGNLARKVFNSKPLTALVVMVVFAIGGGAYILISHAASITAVGFTQLTNHSGYLIAQDNGTVYKCSAANAGHTCPVLSSAISGLWSPITSIDAPPTSTGAFWLLGGDGGVFAKNGAPFYGGPPNTGQGSHTYVAIVGTPSGQGYWVVSKSGTVYSYGDAASTYKVDISKINFTISLGSIAGLSSTGIVSADWGGYGPTAPAGGFAENYGLYLIDGGNGHIYTIGGGVTNAAGNATVGAGEVVTSIFAHGGHSSYLVATNKGGLDAFSGFHFAGNEFGKTSEPIIGVQGYPDSAGKTHYWLLGKYGGIFTFAEAGAAATPFYGSAYGAAPAAPPPAPTCPAGQTGTYPNCVTPPPSTPPPPSGNTGHTYNGNSISACQGFTIQQGDSGTCLQVINYVLLANGINTVSASEKTANSFGATTTAAVKAFQSKPPAITADGIVGPNTWAKMASIGVAPANCGGLVGTPPNCHPSGWYLCPYNQTWEPPMDCISPGTPPPVAACNGIETAYNKLVADYLMEAAAEGAALTAARQANAPTEPYDTNIGNQLNAYSTQLKWVQGYGVTIESSGAAVSCQNNLNIGQALIALSYAQSSERVIHDKLQEWNSVIQNDACKVRGRC